MSRPSWDDTFGKVADVMSDRSTCSRRKVGAVLVQNNRIVATGYNGQPSGETHCVDGGCPRGKFTHDQIPKDADYNLFPCTAIHAEANAIIRAGYALTKGATIYVTEEPCQQCWNLIKGAEIERVIVNRDGSQRDAHYPRWEE